MDRVSHSTDMEIDTNHPNSTRLRGLSDNDPSVEMDNSHGECPSIASNPCVTKDGVDDESPANSKFLSLFKRASDNAPSQKRPRSSDSASSKSSLHGTGDSIGQTSKKPKYKSIMGPIAIAKSSVHAKKTRDAAKQGQLDIKKKQEAKWRETLTGIDPGIEFFDNNVSAACHFKCGKVIKVKQPCDTTRFATHIKGCKGTKKKLNASGGMQMLLCMVSAGNWEAKVMPQAASGAPMEEAPCCGVSERDHKLIPVYLGHTLVKGGGSQSILTIALEKFWKNFSLLGRKQKDIVNDIQMHKQQWQNDHANLCVFSTTCKLSVLVQAIDQDAPPCSDCQGLLRNNKVETALKKPTPLNENYKFVNRRFQDPILGELYARTKGLQDLIESTVCHGLKSKPLLTLNDVIG